MIVVVATMRAKEGKEDNLRDVLMALVVESRQEKGCLQYDLMVGDEEPLEFAMYERWESPAALNTHLRSRHIEVAYDMTKSNITGGNMDSKMASKWFPFVAALFFWIWFSNMLGFLPLPTNTEHEINIFGVEVPAFAIYAATANLSIPLVLTLVVWVSYHVEGVRSKGLFKYLASWLPPGLENMNPAAKAFIFVIEAVSHFARLISLSVRLFANILAGHLLLLFMGGGLAVLLGIAALGALTFPLAFFFFILEVGLIATLQAFIFATLTAIYLGGATSASH